MRKTSIFYLSMTLILIMGLSAHAAEVLDRIVASVNGHIILQSDWEDAIRFDAFTSGRAAAELTAADRKNVLDRLIDQELLREQMGAADFQHTSSEEIQKRIQDIRNQYASAGTAQGWNETLTRYGLTENRLRERIALELDVMRLVDARLRPTIDIDSKSIESYYNQELLPQLRQSGGEEVSLATVTPKIKELLTQQKMNQLLVAWLQNLRSGSQIHTPDAEGASPSTDERQVQ